MVDQIHGHAAIPQEILRKIHPLHRLVAAVDQVHPCRQGPIEGFALGKGVGEKPVGLVGL